MKIVTVSAIQNTVSELCREANYRLNRDIEESLAQSRDNESSPLGREILRQLLENNRIARGEGIAMCQDTGMAVVFVEIGQDVHIEGGNLSEAINEGVRRGYREGCLRKSVVKDPVLRENTGDNTPSVIHYEVVPGDRLKITVAPKGFGSENMSALRMFKPSDGMEAVKQFVIDTVDRAGPNPCPPVIVGVGLGGTMEKAALLAKQALLRPVGSHNAKSHIAALEAELLGKINRLGIGPGGFGGTTTALAVNIETFATHIAGLPVAVNMGCHATRHAEKTL